MLVLIRNIRIRGEKVVDQRDVELDCKRLRLGSGKGRDIQLFGEQVAAEHAVLKPGKAGLRIRCQGKNRIRLAGVAQRRARLANGEWAQIGSHQLCSVEPPPGFDAAIELRIDADASPAIKQRLAHEFALRLPRTRQWAYLLILLVGALTLGLPLLGYYNQDAGALIAEYGGPTDALWSSGPLFSAHQLPETAQYCKVCHVEPFQQVQNKACLTCHQDMTRHFVAGHPLPVAYDGQCSDCHQEHNEPSNLVAQSPALCTDCHMQAMQRHVDTPGEFALPVTGAPAKVKPATAFTNTGHPEFVASLLRHGPTGWHIERARIGSAAAEESSNLKFSHVQHLDFEQVSLADGPSHLDRPLVCADCHVLGLQGKHFEPITMETTCRGCHGLAFDDAAPVRQLPHGEPDKLRVYLEEYYVRQAALTKSAAPAQPARRVPDKMAAYRCDGDPLDCGQAWAAQQMNKLFTDAGCVDCHEVSRENGEWQVQPVKLVSDWFAYARFTHKPHLNNGLEKVPGKQCVRCHAAEQSEVSTDVLMPDLQTCTTCHGDTHTASVPLQCLDCHVFHRKGLQRMALEGPVED